METSAIRPRTKEGAFCLAAIAVVWISTACGRDGWIPFLAWIASLFLVVASFPKKGSKTGLTSFDWALVALVALLSAFFRLYRIEGIPYGFWLDEVWTADNAKSLFEKGPFSPFGWTPLRPNAPGGDRVCNLYLYFAWFIQWTFDYSRLGVKLISVLPGLLAPPALYLFARSFMGRLASFAAGSLFAVSIWHVTLSRWGWAEVLAATLLILVFAPVYKGIRDESPRPFLCAGLLSGLSLYTYHASRIGLLAVLLFMGLWILERRNLLTVRFLLLFLLGVTVAAFPLFMAWSRDPRAFLFRMGQVSILPRVLAGEIDPLIHNAAAHLLMFNWSGDRNPRHNIPGDPMLGGLCGILFLAGLLAAFFRWRRPESRICLVWLSVGLLGGILTDPEEAPQAYRTGMVAPACFLLAGMALERGFFFFREKGRICAGSLLPATLVLIAVSAGLTYKKYFIERPALKETWFSSMGCVGKFIRDEVASAAEKGAEIHIDRAHRNFILDFELERLFHGRAPCGDGGRGAGERSPDPVHWVALEKGGADLSFLYDGPRKIALFVSPRNFIALRRRLAGFRRRFLNNPFRQTVTILVTRDDSLGGPGARRLP